MYFKFYTNNFISLHIFVNPFTFIYVNCGTSWEHFIIAIPEDGLYRPKHAGCNFTASVYFTDFLWFSDWTCTWCRYTSVKTKHSLLKVNSIWDTIIADVIRFRLTSTLKEETDCRQSVWVLCTKLTCFACNSNSKILCFCKAFSCFRHCSISSCLLSGGWGKTVLMHNCYNETSLL